MASKKTNIIISLVIIVIFVALILFGILFSLKGQKQPETAVNVEKAPSIQDQLYEKYKGVSGKWVGEWRDKSYGTHGKITAETFVEKGGKARIEVDMDGAIFGTNDPDLTNFEGGYDTNGYVLKVLNDDFYGDVTITGSSDGKVDVVAKNIPDRRVESLVMSGTVTGMKIDLIFTIFFKDGEQVKGTWILNKQ